MDFKKVTYEANKREVKDPPRFPNVINSYEDESKRDFNTSLSLTLLKLTEQMNSFIKK